MTTTNPLDQKYIPSNIEPQWRQLWEQNGYYKPQDANDSYCLMLPPPNVTGTLHMGHGFQQTLMDILVRFNRMQGKHTLWQGGTDHAGIATQMIVERQLAEQGIKKHDLGREKFLEKTWEWKEKSAGRISEQIREMGGSMDWSRERFTMDEGIQLATKEAFCRLYNEGLIYRGKRLVNWDPKFQTAISDLEVLNQEKQGHLWHIRYPLADDTDKFLIVATTRPETMFGDVAIAVHPEDERYKTLIGTEVTIPLTDRQIPIIADDYVDPEFGSGCVKITPAHDFNDYMVGKRHDFEPINIMHPDVTLNENVPTAYQGMDRLQARKVILEDLEKQNFIDHIDDHTLQIPMGDRSGEIIEPLLTDQWFISMKPLAEPAIEAVKTGKLKIIPEGWTKTYLQWLENIEDWCISRQLWWGHRVPAYYDNEGNIYVGMNEAQVRQTYHLAASVALHQDEDVLDTWFTSALWPFATLGWPEQTPDLQAFYPTQVLVTGFDLIFFWIARMVMFGLHFVGDVPFEEVYIHGLIRDSKGQKMSKSKGNVLDPLDLIHGISLEDLIQKRTATMMQDHLKNQIIKQTKKEFPEGIDAFGTDALRFTFTALAGPSRNINFDLGRIEGYRNFCNKLYNASRFVLQNLPDNTHFTAQPDTFNQIDHWILSELNKTTAEAYKHLNDYRFDLLAHSLYEFVWNVYCDWYLELAKCILYSDHSSQAEKDSTLYTLLNVLDQICRLLHPIIPFITETIWQALKPILNLEADSIMLASYPTSSEQIANHASMQWLQHFIKEIRTMRSSLNVSPNKSMDIMVLNASDSDKQHFETNKPFINQLAKIEQIAFIDSADDLPLTASSYIDPMTIYVPLADLIDMDAEIARNEKALTKIKADMDKLTKKLANKNFVDKAPAEVVTKNKQELEQLNTEAQQIELHLQKLKQA